VRVSVLEELSPRVGGERVERQDLFELVEHEHGSRPLVPQTPGDVVGQGLVGESRG
jgi:hypothetical protein